MIFQGVLFTTIYRYTPLSARNIQRCGRAFHLRGGRALCVVCIGLLVDGGSSPVSKVYEGLESKQFSAPRNSFHTSDLAGFGSSFHLVEPSRIILLKLSQDSVRSWLRQYH